MHCLSVIPTPSSTSVSKRFAAVHSSVITEAIQECLQSAVLGYAGPPMANKVLFVMIICLSLCMK